MRINIPLMSLATKYGLDEAWNEDTFVFDGGADYYICAEKK